MALHTALPLRGYTYVRMLFIDYSTAFNTSPCCVCYLINTATSDNEQPETEIAFRCFSLELKIGTAFT